MQSDTHRMWKQYNNDVMYLIEHGLFPVVNKTIIKIDAVDDNSNDYKDKTGIHFMNEKTLIIGDDDNNVYLVFEKDNEVITTNKRCETCACSKQLLL